MNVEHIRIFREIREKNLRDFGVDPASEASLLKAIRSTKDYYRLKDIVIALYDVGTTASLEELEELLYHPKEDIIICAFNAIVTIMGSEGQDKYLEKLNDPKFRDKFGAIIAIRQYCDGRAIEAVTKRLKAILARERKKVHYSTEGLTEILAAFDYLRSQTGDCSDNAYTLIRSHLNRLEPKEINWIEIHHPDLHKHYKIERISSSMTTIGQHVVPEKSQKNSWFAGLWKR